MITKYIKEDITKTELMHIAHGVNCCNVMGSGVAKSIFTVFPKIKTEYHIFCKDQNPKDLLGKIQSVVCDDKIIYNCFTQLNYGYDGRRYLNYSAISECFKLLIDSCKGNILAIPKIGSGLAGGDWKFVEQLINDTVGDDLEIWVYDNSSIMSSGQNDMG